MSPKDFRHSIKVPSSLHTLTVEPLTASRFRPYGQVIAAPEEATSSMANQGSAQRFNFIAEIINHRSPLANSCYPGSLPHPDSNSTQKHISLSPSIGIPPAVPNLCLFRSTPRNLPFQLSLLERHKYSTQMFVPMTPPGGSRGYLVVVAANSVATDKPDLSTLKAFLATSSQGFNYQPGTWHSPMIALEKPTDFVCLVHERREMAVDEDEDTEEVFFDRAVLINVPGYCNAVHKL